MIKFGIVLALATVAMAQNLPRGGYSVDDLISGRGQLNAPPGQQYNGPFKPPPPGAIIQPPRNPDGSSLYQQQYPAIQPPRNPDGSSLYQQRYPAIQPPRQQYPSQPRPIDGRYNSHGPKYVTRNF